MSDSKKIPLPVETLPRRTGRPSEYNEEIAARFCQLMTSGLSLPKICRLPGMPSVFTVTKWWANPSFAAAYDSARKARAEVLASELIELADKVKMGKRTKRSRDGVEVIVGDNVDRSRLMCDVRKWYLSKVLPKIYGDRVDVNVSGEVDLVAVLRRRVAGAPRPGVDDETANTKQIEGETLPESDS